MREHLKFYIDGAWVDPLEPRRHHVIDPSTEQPCAAISLGGAQDVDRAVAAARRAFESWSRRPVADRIAVLERIVAVYRRRLPELAAALSEEMGAPMWLATAAQAPSGLGHLASTIAALEAMHLEESRGTVEILREPIGVCGLITPWNWPLNQISCKVAPALAAGCTMVLKPSELAPVNAILFAEILHEAGVPPGVFNLVNGDGPGVGEAMSAHPGIDMMSFTGSTRAGILVARAAADTVKRVTQELGGKSPNIVLDDADLERAVRHGVGAMFNNSGQSCNAPSRMLVPQALHDRAAEIARQVASTFSCADPRTAQAPQLGPVANANQFAKIQRLIQSGIDEGATLLVGGTGRPEGFARGYFVKPTVFANARPDMTIAREEIFGPVLTILPYRDEEDAIRIANDTPYGLSSYVQSGSLERARGVARRIRAGNVHINGAPLDSMVGSFGGYKQSGNGREWGEWGLADFLEIKSVYGWTPRAAAG